MLVRAGFLVVPLVAALAVLAGVLITRSVLGISVLAQAPCDGMP